jgi:hypothetical protein
MPYAGKTGGAIGDLTTMGLRKFPVYIVFLRKNGILFLIIV